MVIERTDVPCDPWRTLFVAGAIGAATDGQLLDRFVTGRGDPGAEAAFGILVDRHGPMVLRVCRRVLGDGHDAQDASQATFLVLARKAGSIRSRESVASWLFGVAHRIAQRARREAARRRDVERRGALMRPEAVEEPRQDGDGSLIVEEIARLSEADRSAVVLCDLEGRSYAEAARQLDWPLGTLKARLSRARGRLRSRLVRRGLAPSDGSWIGPLAATATAPAIRWPGSRPVLVGGDSATRLARACLKEFAMSKLKTTAALLLLAAGTLSIGVGIAVGAIRMTSGGSGDDDAARSGGAAASTASAPQGDLAKLQGSWEAKTGLQPDYADLIWVIRAGRCNVSVRAPDGVTTIHDVELTIDETTTPKSLDFKGGIAPEGPLKSISRSIYELDGNTLKICAGYPDGPRPSEFKAGVEGRAPELLIFERRGNSTPEADTDAEKPIERSRPAPSGILRGDLAKLQGTWAAARFGPREDSTLVCEIHGSIFTKTVVGPGGAGTSIPSDLTFDEAVESKAIDFIRPIANAKIEKGIYRVEDDTLTICIGAPGGPRPTEFKADQERPPTLIVLKRRGSPPS